MRLDPADRPNVADLTHAFDRVATRAIERDSAPED
jgi:hypothetical protein